MENKEIRLNKYIANSGICSRREADNLITKGYVRVNGKKIISLGYKVQKSDTITYNGKTLSLQKKVYILLNKPKDFITTTKDPKNRKTVLEIVKNASEERIYPVGRLDRGTTGLLLLTNDGDTARYLSHPSNKIRKVYSVILNKPLTNHHYKLLKKNILLKDGEVKLDALHIIDPEGKNLGVEIHIGKNRIVRRIFEHFNYEVVKLDRVLYGPLTKKNLSRGQWRFLDKKEISQIIDKKANDF